VHSTSNSRPKIYRSRIRILHPNRPRRPIEQNANGVRGSNSLIGGDRHRENTSSPSPPRGMSTTESAKPTSNPVTRNPRLRIIRRAWNSILGTISEKLARKALKYIDLSLDMLLYFPLVPDDRKLLIHRSLRRLWRSLSRFVQCKLEGAFCH
jgi:hypothetical protein